MAGAFSPRPSYVAAPAPTVPVAPSQPEDLTGEGVRHLQIAAALPVWRDFIVGVQKNPYAMDTQVIITVNSRWYALSAGERLKVATDWLDVFRPHAPRGFLLVWNEQQQTLARQALGGGMTLTDD